ncbi:MAG: hypothetical protein AAFW89_07410 [Bacteroidota bacterium]
MNNYTQSRLPYVLLIIGFFLVGFLDMILSPDESQPPITVYVQDAQAENPNLPSPPLDLIAITHTQSLADQTTTGRTP